MISILQKGKYSLLKTLEQIKLLVLEKKWFVWVKTDKGIMLTIKQKRPTFGNEIVQSGNYRIYRIYDEKGFPDGMYLELFIGAGKRECYYVAEGLPTKKNLTTFLRPVEHTIAKTTPLVNPTY